MTNINATAWLIMFLACLALLGTSCIQKQPSVAMDGFTAPKKLSFSPAGGISSENYDAKVDKRTFTLTGPDNPKQPTAWQGPLVIGEEKSGKSCEAKVSLVTEVYSVSKGEMALVLSYSGSQTYLYFIDTSNCSNRYPRIEAFTEGISIADNRITILPACECPGKDTACDCSAGQVLSLNSQSRQPIPLDNESKALTKSILGVEFQGRHKVLNPKTSSASLVND